MFHYILIPALVIVTAYFSGSFVPADRIWYGTLTKPWFSPPAWVFGPVWSVLYLLLIIAALLVWNTFERGALFTFLCVLFIVNLMLNVAWCYVFFNQHMVGFGLVVALLLALTVYGLIVCIAPTSWKIALLLVPYAVWSTFACVLNFSIWRLNI